MLDEVLTTEERAVVARAKAFAQEHVAPNAARWEWERRYPLETIKAACAAGLNTIELAKKHGGQGLSFSCKLRAFEEIARHDFAFAFALINHHNAVARFARDGKPAQPSTDGWISCCVGGGTVPLRLSAPDSALA